MATSHDPAQPGPSAPPATTTHPAEADQRRLRDLQNTVYLDHYATTPLSAAARSALHGWLAMGPGNPSSIHGSGQSSRHALDAARRSVAHALGAAPRQVVFTSGATEANALAWHSVVAKTPRGRAVISAAEHASVRAAAARAEAHGWRVDTLPLDAQGRVDLSRAADVLATPCDLLSVLAVSNELGTVQPSRALAAMARASGAVVHVDATQALGKLAGVSLQQLDADLLSVSGHKVGALPGVGALLVRDGLVLSPLVAGHQEEGRRGGTENLAGAVTFGAACAALPARLAAHRRLRELRDRLADAVAALDAPTHRHAAELAANDDTGSCLSVAFPGCDAADLVMALDLEGVAVSAGAACSSGTMEPSPVVLALLEGHPDAARLAASTLRITLGPETTAADIDAATAALERVVARLLP